MSMLNSSVRPSMLAAATIAVLTAVVALGQDPKAQLQEKVAAVKQSLAENQKALQQYSWTETTEISLKGEVKKTSQKSCRYGADGKAIKTPIAAPAAAAPPAQPGGKRGGRGGRLKENIVENKVEDMKEYMEKAAALIHQYVPPQPAKIQAAQQAGKVALNKEASPGIAELAVTDYNLPGDKLTLAFNSAAKQMAKVGVDSYLDKKDDTVTLAVRFAALPDGVSYPAETVLTVKAKNIQVKIMNSGYKKAGTP